jgi:hypothetical protein
MLRLYLFGLSVEEWILGGAQLQPRRAKQELSERRPNERSERGQAKEPL